jgi:hypothetical protein
MDNLEEMNKFLDAFDLTKLNQEDIIHLNRYITSKKIKSVTKDSQGRRL